MRIAVIDLGTNTFHLLIAEVNASAFKVVYREKSAVKIGENGINEGRITSEAAARALSTLRKFKDRIDIEHVHSVFATATSAIRNASNGQEVLKMIKDHIGIDVRIITGMEEANYIYYGVAHALDLGEGTSLIMDIGGGSIEFIIGNREKAFWMHSFEIGGLRMVEQFQKHDPILPLEVIHVENYLSSHLDLLFEKVIEYMPSTLVGSSGTFDTLSDIYRIDQGIEKIPGNTEYLLTLDGFNKIFKEILLKNRQQRLDMPGMIGLRVDMIVVASILINFILVNTGIEHLRVSSYALKEGVLLKTIDSLPIAAVPAENI